MDDQLKGKGEQVVGKAKEEFGRVTGDTSTEWTGKVERLKGRVREAIGDVKSRVAAEKWRIEPKVKDGTRKP